MEGKTFSFNNFLILTRLSRLVKRGHEYARFGNTWISGGENCKPFYFRHVCRLSVECRSSNGRYINPERFILSSPIQSRLQGRPASAISVKQVQSLRDSVCFRWMDIARILCVSSRTLSCRRQELGMFVGHASNWKI